LQTFKYSLSIFKTVENKGFAAFKKGENRAQSGASGPPVFPLKTFLQLFSFIFYQACKQRISGIPQG
jgi:hypothetical protein